MKISILTPDLSDNCVGRAYLLAKVLQRYYEVEIVGPLFKDEIWEPVAYDKSITYKTVKISGKLKPYWLIGQLISKIEGEVVYANKSLYTSLGIGLIKKRLKKIPLILDIDDWQLGFRKEDLKQLSFIHKVKFLAFSTLYFYNTASYWNNLVFEKLSCFADEVTVSNNFLNKKFGGTLIPHGRDTDLFDPEKFDRIKLRKEYRIKRNKKIVLFFGTPKPHKGIEDIINAIKLNSDQNITLLLVGIDYNDPFCKNIIEKAEKKLGREKFINFGLQPFKKVPEFLAMADVVVIPQRKNFSTVGQVPAKVFDAMAMAKPIIATNVSDLPKILDGCGWLVEPENPEQLAKQIEIIFNNLEKANKIGQKARNKCIENYSWNSMEKTLKRIFHKYE